jgi:magnesium transporter
VGERRVQTPSIQLIDYSAEAFDIYDSVTPEQCLALEKNDSPAWIRVTGLHEPKLVRDVLDHYGIHPLIHQDVLNTTHPPKLDDCAGYLFLTMRIMPADLAEVDQHFCMVLTDRVLITFQEAPTEVFEPVISRLREGRGRLRKLGPDYLCWCLLDAVVDHYLRTLDNIEDEVARLEDALMAPQQPDPNMQDFYSLRVRSQSVNRTLRPLREMISRLLRLDSRLIDSAVSPYLHDLYDHAWHASETADHLRESITALREYYQSTLSQRLNEVMRVLAAISTIFLPLTFIAGVYGMNFDVQPELHWKYGYFLVWGLFIAISVIMLWYFRKRRWL